MCVPSGPSDLDQREVRQQRLIVWGPIFLLCSDRNNSRGPQRDILLCLCVSLSVSLSRVGPELVWIPSVWTNLCKVYLRAAHNKNYNERNLTPSAGDATITTCSQGGFSNDSNNKTTTKANPGRQELTWSPLS